MMVFPNQVQINNLNSEHLFEVAKIHCAAFPHSVLTDLGLDIVRRYYDWQLIGPHDIAAVGAFSEMRLIGFCFAGGFNGALSGFIGQNWPHLAWQICSHPLLLRKPIFRERVVHVAPILYKRLLRRKRNIAISKISGRASFGILVIATDPEYQGNGVGTVLMDRIEVAARQRGHLQMHLMVHPDNSNATRFYEKLGWQKIHQAGDRWHGQMRKYLVSH